MLSSKILADGRSDRLVWPKDGEFVAYAGGTPTVELTFLFRESVSPVQYGTQRTRDATERQLTTL